MYTGSVFGLKTGLYEPETSRGGMVTLLQRGLKPLGILVVFVVKTTRYSERPNVVAVSRDN